MALAGGVCNVCTLHPPRVRDFTVTVPPEHTQPTKSRRFPQPANHAVHTMDAISRGNKMAFFWTVVILSLAFVAGWYYLPKGWLTRATGAVTSVFTAVFTDLAEILPMLADLRWHTVLTEMQANVVQFALAFAMIVAYGRKKG